MRDENDYHLMGRGELRRELDRVSKDLAAWSYALQKAKQEQAFMYIDGYRLSTAKSTTERKMDAECHADMLHREMLDAQGYVDFLTVIRDNILSLLVNEEHPLYVMNSG